MPRNLHKKPLTLLIIPHSQHEPISVRIPSWIQAGLFLIAAAVAIGVAAFGLRYHAMTQEVARLQEAQRVAVARQQVLQQLLLSQHQIVRAIDLSPDALLKVETDPAARALQAYYGALPGGHRELEYLSGQGEGGMAASDPGQVGTSEALVGQLALRQAAPQGWPVEGQVSSSFGYRVFRDHRNFHSGLDIVVSPRTPVHATADGTVIAADWQSGYGWTVELEHEQGYSTLYGHLTSYLVEVGDKVREGQSIGLSGNSGNSTGPHLHYEIRLNGVPIDPWRYATAGGELGR